jgi:hypothetical protein
MRHIVVASGVFAGVIAWTGGDARASISEDDAVVAHLLKHEEAREFGPVRVVGRKDLPPDVWHLVKDAVAFRLHRPQPDGTTAADPVFYLARTSALYVRASDALRTGYSFREYVWCLLVAVLAHEAAHTAPRTEREALAAELKQLRRCFSRGHLQPRNDWSPMGYIGKVEARLKNTKGHH